METAVPVGAVAPPNRPSMLHWQSTTRTKPAVLGRRGSRGRFMLAFDDEGAELTFLAEDWERNRLLRSILVALTCAFLILRSAADFSLFSEQYAELEWWIVAGKVLVNGLVFLVLPGLRPWSGKASLQRWTVLTVVAYGLYILHLLFIESWVTCRAVADMRAASAAGASSSAAAALPSPPLCSARTAGQVPWEPIMDVFAVPYLMGFVACVPWHAVFAWGLAVWAMVLIWAVMALDIVAEDAVFLCGSVLLNALTVGAAARRYESFRRENFQGRRALAAELTRSLELTEQREAERFHGAAARRAAEHHGDLRVAVTEDLYDEILISFSHELREPLFGVRSLVSDLIDDASCPHSVVRDLQEVQLASDRLDSVVSELVDMERIRRGDVAVHAVPVDVRAMLTHAVRVQADSGAKVELSVDPRVPRTMTIDGGRFRQILSAALTSAVRASRGPVRLTVEPAAGKVGVEAYRQGDLAAGGGGGVRHRRRPDAAEGTAQGTRPASAAHGMGGAGGEAASSDPAAASQELGYEPLYVLFRVTVQDAKQAAPARGRGAHAVAGTAAAAGSGPAGARGRATRAKQAATRFGVGLPVCRTVVQLLQGAMGVVDASRADDDDDDDDYGDGLGLGLGLSLGHGRVLAGLWFTLPVCYETSIEVSIGSYSARSALFAPACAVPAAGAGANIGAPPVAARIRDSRDAKPHGPECAGVTAPPAPVGRPVRDMLDRTRSFDDDSGTDGGLSVAVRAPKVELLAEAPAPAASAASSS